MKMRQKREGFKGQRIVVVPRPVLERTARDPLLKGLLPTDAGYYPKAKGHICAREEGAPETIFIYCAEGKGWCEIGGRWHDVVANQLLVVPAFTPHVYGAAKTIPWTIHWFHAVGTNMPFYLERLGVAKEKPVVSLAGDVYLFSLFEEVVEALEGAPKSALPGIVAGWLDASDASVRLALLKLITGGLRVGVSARLAKVALAEMGSVAADDVEEVWHGLAPPYLPHRRSLDHSRPLLW